MKTLYIGLIDYNGNQNWSTNHCSHLWMKKYTTAMGGMAMANHLVAMAMTMMLQMSTAMHPVNCAKD